MATFSEMKQEVLSQTQAGGKKTFSESTFNKLTSAMLNETGYEAKIVKRSKDGEVREEILKPVDEFRQKVIGTIAKQAGVDKDETEKLISEYKFPSDTPWYPVVSEALTNSMEAGKTFTALSKGDMVASFSMETISEQVKMNGAPGAPDSEKKPVVYGEHRRIKCSSGCPKWLRKGQ